MAEDRHRQAPFDAGPSLELKLEPLRLAVFGWVQDGVGSVGSAHYQLCRALISAGHHIDFYADPSFIPHPGYRAANFEYVPVEVSFKRELKPDRFPPSLRVFIDRMRGMARTWRYREHGMIVARSRHARMPYNAVVFLGTPPGSTIEGVPTIVWPQSAPQNELLAVREAKAAIVRVSGLPAYLRLRLYYEVKDRIVWRWARHHWLILCSRRARAQAISFGVPPERVCIAPYPIDLARFAPAEAPRGPTRRVVCIGRLDPRKRVDLLIDAVELLSSRRRDFTVDVIGRDGYMSGWSDLVRRASRSLPITYTDAVPQAEIVQRLHGADVAVQPSEHEEFGHAVAEALACGVPVVIGPTNGTGDYAPTAGSAAFDRYEPQSLAAALELALESSRDPAARSACRAAAGAFAADRVASTVAAFIRNARF